MSDTKVCTKCGISKPYSYFYKDKSKRDGYRNECKVCKNMYAKNFRSTEEYKAWKRSNSNAYYHKVYKHSQDYKLKEKARRVRRDYGISLLEYNRLLDTPCDICGSKATDCDHDHLTGKVRGGLCSKCNHMLGFSRDDTDILANAIKYLKEHSDV